MYVDPNQQMLSRKQEEANYAKLKQKRTFQQSPIEMKRAKTTKWQNNVENQTNNKKETKTYQWESAQAQNQDHWNQSAQAQNQDNDSGIKQNRPLLPEISIALDVEARYHLDVTTKVLNGYRFSSVQIRRTDEKNKPFSYELKRDNVNTIVEKLEALFAYFSSPSLYSLEVNNEKFQFYYIPDDMQTKIEDKFFMLLHRQFDSPFLGFERRKPNEKLFRFNVPMHAVPGLYKALEHVQTLM